MLKKANKISKTSGFTLIELIIVIAILGVLASIAVPKLSGAKTLAQNKVDEANASILTGIAHKILAETGSFPEEAEWGTFFTEFPASNSSYLASNIDIQNKSNIFEYSESAGKVTVGKLVDSPNQDPSQSEPPSLTTLIKSIISSSFTFDNSASALNPILKVPVIDGVNCKFIAVSGKENGNADISISLPDRNKAEIARNNGYSSKEFTLTLQISRGNEPPVERNFIIVIPGRNNTDNPDIVIR